MDLSTLISTAQVPPQYLQSLFLASHIPYKALASDPRISYKLYIPPEHLNANPADPTMTLPLLPLVVIIHGTRRNTDLERWVSWSHSHPCAILVPLFPAGLDGPNDLDSYKVLTSRTLRSDLALLGMLEEVAQRWPGISTAKIFLVGFSGGGQFAQRFFYLYPERLHAVSMGAPGRITTLDDTLDWPQGIRNVQGKFHRTIDIEKLRNVKNIQLVVGEQDIEVHGGEEFSKWLDSMRSKLKRKEGNSDEDQDQLAPMRTGRLESARIVLAEWENRGVEAKFDVVPGVAHSSQGVLDTVLEFLGQCITRYRDGKR